MKLISFNQVGSIGESGSDIFYGYLVFAHDFFFSHAAREFSDNACNGYSCSSNDRFTMLYSGVNNNPLSYFHFSHLTQLVHTAVS